MKYNFKEFDFWFMQPWLFVLLFAAEVIFKIC